ncbi:MAG: bifunctional non-ous end joining protein LigD [Phycisphaerales bacterium]|jgi:bifunctional non-homologous end joining protein LigD|nr:bifunctional non-ous end joining protein LigD [Phycisphaerales bacterium]
MPAVKIGKKSVDLSNLDKVLYPSGFTKAQIIDYYHRIAPVLLPHLKGRGITLKRYPSGTDKEHFFEKQCPPYRPAWVKTASVPRRIRAGDIDYCLINDEADLIWVANLAAIELHVPLAKAPHWNRPTEMVFDLDPGEPATLIDCCRFGLKFRDVLARLDLQAFAKTSGGKGLHVYVPLNTPGVTFADTKEFARAIAMIFERENPKHITSTMTKSLRPGKIFVDWSQNDETKTTVSVYSLRAKDRPTVSTPVTWDEVESAAKRRDASMITFVSDDVLERVERLGDLFAPVLKVKQKLPIV